MLIALGCILVAFILAVIFITSNLKYTLYERNVQDKVSYYRLGEWYYNSLTYKEQLLYNEIKDSANKIKDKTDNLPYLYTDEEFNKIVKSVKRDNPELFYLMENQTQLYTTKKKSNVKLAYYDKKSVIKKMRKELNNKVESIMSILENKSKYESDFDVEVAIHDYILLNCKIAGNGEHDSIYDTAYGALMHGEAYSGGYSSLFKLLMNKYGLTCYIIEGEVDNQPHFWNMVYINDSYFHVDVAWNDADISYSDDLLFHGYFNVSTNIITEDHNIADTDYLPAAHTESNYYNIRNLYVNDLDDLKMRINRIILDALEKGNMFIELYTNFGAEVYEGEEYRKILIESIRQINNSDSIHEIDELFRIYKASNNKNILTIQFYNLEK
jgi:Uncharacterized protein involved in cytokinesis, contains TGc (transglutaminase/protease-like) domain